MINRPPVNGNYDAFKIEPFEIDVAIPISNAGELLRTLRAKAGMSQKELGRLAHYTGPYISFIETGRFVPSPDVMVKLLAALGYEICFTVRPVCPNGREGQS